MRPHPIAAATLLLALATAGCQVMLTDLAERGDVVLDCSTPGAVPSRDGFQCLSGSTSRAAAYYGPEVEALWGTWDGADYGFCFTLAADGTGEARVRTGEGGTRVEPLRWGVVVDEYGWVERSPTGLWPLYLESSIDAIPHVLFWRASTYAFARWPLLAHRACGL